MSKELKAPDKVTQKMTRDGAVAENLTTGETSSISERPQEENYSAPAGVAAEKVVQHIGAEIERHAAKGAEKKALDGRAKRCYPFPVTGDDGRGCPEPREEMPAGWHRYGR